MKYKSSRLSKKLIFLNSPFRLFPISFSAESSIFEPPNLDDEDRDDDKDFYKFEWDNESHNVFDIITESE